MDRADVVAKELTERYSGNTFHNAGQADAWLTNAIAAALRSYGDCRIEEAAKAAENTWDYIPQETWDDGFEPDYQLTQKTAAERIRALKTKSEPGEGKGR